MFSYSVYDVLSDPFVGKAVLIEQGEGYAVSAYSSVALLIFGLVAGTVLNWWREKTSLNKKMHANKTTRMI